MRSVFFVGWIVGLWFYGCNKGDGVPALAVDKIEPLSGLVGSQVVITGKGFGTHADQIEVLFGTAVAPITSVQETRLEVTVPKSASSVNISVRVGAQKVTYSQAFVVQAPPPFLLTKMVPASGPIGTKVTITGEGFGTDKNAIEVRFGEAKATIASLTDTEIITAVPKGAKNGKISLIKGTRAIESSASFQILAATPFSLSSVSPTVGKIGTTVTLTGEGFGTDKNALQVRFGTTAASITSLTNTQLITSVPAGAQNGKVSITKGAQTAQSVITFKVILHNITSFSPTTGAIGTTVVITGEGFGTQADQIEVRFGNIMAAISAITNTQITTSVPRKASTGLISVTKGGLRTDSESVFTVPGTVEAHRVTGMSPSRGVVGTSVSITGERFGTDKSAVLVRFGATDAASQTISSITDTQIILPVPSGTPSGEQIVSVTKGGQTARAPSPFTVIVAHTITAINPTQGHSGTSVTITGTNFGTVQNAVQVHFGSTLATISAITNTQITTSVPSSTPQGAQAVSVTRNGIKITATPSFNVTAPPAPSHRINSFTPTTGTPGTQVTILGENFGTRASNIQVKFGNTSVSSFELRALPSRIIAQVPTGAQTGKISVILNGETAVSATDFTVVNATFSISSKTSCNKSSGEVTFFGSGFGTNRNAVDVRFGTAKATITFISNKQVTAEIPSGLSQGAIKLSFTKDGHTVRFDCTIPAPPAFAITRFSSNNDDNKSGVARDWVTITGTGFGDKAEKVEVKFGMAKAHISSISSTTIGAHVPPTAAVGQNTLSVTKDGKTLTFTGKFTVKATTSQKAARESFLNKFVDDYLIPADKENLWWKDGNLENCNAGKIEDAQLERAYKSYLYFRHLAGYSASNSQNPRLAKHANSGDATHLADAQKGALMLAANKKLSHIFDETDKCYTVEGLRSTSHAQSNVAVFLTGSGIAGFLQESVFGHIKDEGDHNKPVGHRQALLSPLAEVVYMGATDISSVIVVDSKITAVPDGKTVPDYVMWPPEGYIIDDLVNTRWSFSIVKKKRAGSNPVKYFTNATVKVSNKGTGTEISSDIIYRTDQKLTVEFLETLVWEVNVPKPANTIYDSDNPNTGNAKDVTYTVEIKGIQNNGSKTSHTYDVTLIDFLAAMRYFPDPSAFRAYQRALNGK